MSNGWLQLFKKLLELIQPYLPIAAGIHVGQLIEQLRTARLNLEIKQSEDKFDEENAADIARGTLRDRVRERSNRGQYL